MVTHEERKFTISNAFAILTNNTMTKMSKEEIIDILLKTELYVYKNFPTKDSYFMNMNDQIIKLKNMLFCKAKPVKNLRELKAMETRSGLKSIVDDKYRGSAQKDDSGKDGSNRSHVEKKYLHSRSKKDAHESKNGFSPGNGNIFAGGTNESPRTPSVNLEDKAGYDHNYKMKSAGENRRTSADCDISQGSAFFKTNGENNQYQTLQNKQSDGYCPTAPHNARKPSVEIPPINTYPISNLPRANLSYPSYRNDNNYESHYANPIISPYQKSHGTNSNITINTAGAPYNSWNNNSTYPSPDMPYQYFNPGANNFYENRIPRMNFYVEKKDGTAQNKNFSGDGKDMIYTINKSGEYDYHNRGVDDTGAINYNRGCSIADAYENTNAKSGFGSTHRLNINPDDRLMDPIHENKNKRTGCYNKNSKIISENQKIASNFFGLNEKTKFFPFQDPSRPNSLNEKFLGGSRQFKTQGMSANNKPHKLFGNGFNKQSPSLYSNINDTVGGGIDYSDSHGFNIGFKNYREDQKNFVMNSNFYCSDPNNMPISNKQNILTGNIQSIPIGKNRIPIDNFNMVNGQFENQNYNGRPSVNDNKRPSVNDNRRPLVNDNGRPSVNDNRRPSVNDNMEHSANDIHYCQNDIDPGPHDFGLNLSPKSHMKSYPNATLNTNNSPMEPKTHPEFYLPSEGNTNVNLEFPKTQRKYQDLNRNPKGMNINPDFAQLQRENPGWFVQNMPMQEHVNINQDFGHARKDSTDCFRQFNTPKIPDRININPDLSQLRRDNPEYFNHPIPSTNPEKITNHEKNRRETPEYFEKSERTNEIEGNYPTPDHFEQTNQDLINNPVRAHIRNFFNNKTPSKLHDKATTNSLLLKPSISYPFENEQVIYNLNNDVVNVKSKVNPMLKRSVPNVNSGPDCNMASGLDCNMASGTDCNMASGTDCNMASGTDCNMASGTDCNMASGTDCNMVSSQMDGKDIQAERTKMQDDIFNDKKRRKKITQVNDNLNQAGRNYRPRFTGSTSSINVHRKTNIGNGSIKKENMKNEIAGKAVVIGGPDRENSLEQPSTQNIITIQHINKIIESDVEYKNLKKAVDTLFAGKHEVVRTIDIAELLDYLVEAQQKFIIFSAKTDDKRILKEYKLVKLIARRELANKAQNKSFISNTVISGIKNLVEKKIENVLERRIEYSRIDAKKLTNLRDEMIESVIKKFKNRISFDDEFILNIEDE